MLEYFIFNYVICLLEGYGLSTRYVVGVCWCDAPECKMALADYGGGTYA